VVRIVWTVARGQLGTTAAAAVVGAAVTSDFGSPAAAVASPFATPASVNAFLTQATAIQQQSGLTLDAINYLLTPQSSITGGWATTSQMTPANISATLTAVQQAVLNLISASTTLTANIGAADTTITVASYASSAAATTLTAAITTTTQTSIQVESAIGFPAPNFYVDIGDEVLLVTAFNDA
jgi:hypothetical protein